MADSNIEQLLKQILGTKLGKDMRQAIHDGIEQCYEDGKVGAVDLVARQRIDNLSKLEPGSTTGDAELRDIRIGYDGTEYENAGEAVREQVSDLKSAIPKVDSTLSNTGKAADAKATGDAINSLSEEILKPIDFEKIGFGKDCRYGTGYFTGDIINETTNVYGSFGLIIECSPGETLYCNFKLSSNNINTVQILDNVPQKNYGALTGVIGTIEQQENDMYEIPNSLANAKAAYFPIAFNAYPKMMPDHYEYMTLQNIDFTSAKSYYRSVNTKQLEGLIVDPDKNKLLYASLFSAVSEMVGAKVYISGDSITEQSASITNNGEVMYLGWYDRIAIKYNQEYECHGYSGHMWYSTASLPHSAVSDVKKIIESGIEYHYIILEWGTNDITRGKFGSADDVASDENDCGTVAAMRWCIENLQSNLPNTRIIVIMPCMRNGNARQEQYYELVEPILKSYGVRRVYMAWDSGITINMMNPDGIHFRYQDEEGTFIQNMTGIKKYSKCLEAEMLKA